MDQQRNWTDAFTLKIAYEGRPLIITIRRRPNEIRITYKFKSLPMTLGSCSTCGMQYCNANLDREFSKLSVKRLFRKDYKLRLCDSRKTFMNNISRSCLYDINIISNQDECAILRTKSQEDVTKFGKLMDSEPARQQDIPDWRESYFIALKKAYDWPGASYDTMLEEGQAFILTRTPQAITIGWITPDDEDIVIKLGESPGGYVNLRVAEARSTKDAPLPKILLWTRTEHLLSRADDTPMFLTALHMALGDDVFNVLTVESIVNYELDRRDRMRAELDCRLPGFTFSRVLNLGIVLPPIKRQAGSDRDLDCLAIDLAMGRAGKQESAYYYKAREAAEAARISRRRERERQRENLF